MVSNKLPGAGWRPYTVEVGEVWRLIKTLPAGTLKDWVVSAWLDVAINPAKPTKRMRKKSLNRVQICDGLVREANTLLDTIREDTTQPCQRK